MKRLSLCLILILSQGCGYESRDPSKTDVAPVDITSTTITVEIWEKLGHEEKFMPETLQKLRSDNKNLRSASNWKKFSEEVVKPAFQREIVNAEQ